MTKYRCIRIRGSDIRWPDCCACCCEPHPGEVRQLARSEKVYFSLGVITEWVTCHSDFEVPLCGECKKHIAQEELSPLLYGMVVLVPGVLVPLLGYQGFGERLESALVRWVGMEVYVAENVSIGSFVVLGILWTLFLMVSLTSWLAKKELAEGRSHAQPTCASFEEPVLYAAYSPCLEEAEVGDQYLERKDKSEYSFDIVVAPTDGGYLDRFIEANRSHVLEISEPVER